MQEYKVICRLQVRCRAVVCPAHFKTQHFYEILRAICPEMDTAPAGMLRSSRFDKASVKCQI